MSRQKDDAISERVKQDRRAAVVLHTVRWDDPSAGSRRAVRAVCGEWVTPAEVADDRKRERVTCARCLEWLAGFEAMEVEG
jgi:hypothetical protein